MFEVTEKANEKLQEFFKDRDGAAIIRVFLSQGG
jgi:Fe-S cluster assembly iron-binding protein IscA